jgi:hypothetical protein
VLCGLYEENRDFEQGPGQFFKTIALGHSHPSASKSRRNPAIPLRQPDPGCVPPAVSSVRRIGGGGWIGTLTAGAEIAGKKLLEIVRR